MQRRFQYLVGGCGAVFALAVGYFVLGVDVSTTTAAVSPDPGLQTVNRALKADRLPMKPAFRLPTIPASKSRRNAGNEIETRDADRAARTARRLRAAGEPDRTVPAGAGRRPLPVLI